LIDLRRALGYSHIPQRYARPINEFYQSTFNPWLNLHRPCLFAKEWVDDKGKITKRYAHKDVKTPLACLALLAAQDAVRFKPGVTLEQLQAQALAQTDLAAARAMQKAKAALFELFNTPQSRADVAVLERKTST
jgi:hypothetical protein